MRIVRTTFKEKLERLEKLPERVRFKESLHIWPDGIVLMTALLGIGTLLGVYFGSGAVATRSLLDTVKTIILMVIALYGVFRLFRLSNYVIFFVGSVGMALLVVVVGHTYAFVRVPLASQGLAPELVVLDPTDIISLCMAVVTTEIPFWSIRVVSALWWWSLQAVMVIGAAICAPLLVCVMYEESD